jgi:hypothetical protein
MTGYPDGIFSWFSSVHPGYCWAVLSYTPLDTTFCNHSTGFSTEQEIFLGKFKDTQAGKKLPAFKVPDD